MGWKYLLTLILSPPALIVQAWPITLAALALMITLLVNSRIDSARVLRIGWMMWLILGLLVAYQLVALNPRTTVVVPGNLLLAVLAAHLLTPTTPTPGLLGALIAAPQPIWFIGFNPEWVALTTALMIRSIPYLLGLFDDARDAARARRAERNTVALFMSTMLGSIAHAECTDKALAARGLGERKQ